MSDKNTETLKRFWSKVEKTDACWFWQGSISPGARHGYGQFFVGEQRIPAHRFAYEALVGPIPDGLKLDHLCRNRSCVNPAHLEPVTSRENILRGVGFAAENARKTHCPSGHEYSEENTYFLVSRPTWRYCRTCAREKMRRRRAKLAGGSNG